MRLLLVPQLLTAVAALAVRGAVDIAADLSSMVPSSPVAVEYRARWSDFAAPQPNVIVNVTTEKDVATVVKYCAKYKVPFLPQNGGNGWKTFSLVNGVLINLGGLNQVTVAGDRTTATIGGGAIISETINAADAAGVLVQTGNCNCVGTLGALLGGGYGNTMGERGFAVDNVVSLRVVTADGNIVTASSTQNPDLFWALRGAGPNFGIVTSAVVKTLPETDRSAWIMTLTFPASKVTQVAQAIQDLPLLPQQVVYLVLTNSGDAKNTPVVMVTGFLRKGTETSGRKAYASLFALGPDTISTGVQPYPKWNAANDGFCTRGGFKPAYSTTINNMKSQSWSQIWKLYTDFQAKPGAANSAVLIERYNLTKAQSTPTGSAAFNEALRREAFAQAIFIPWYDNPAYDQAANTFASSVRDILKYKSSAKSNPTYANFAHGDEDLSAIYGTSLDRLKKLKKQYDPQNIFNQWFNIK